MGDRILLRGGHVLTMDQRLGELAGGDVLIEDGPIIVDVARHIDVQDAEIAGRRRARGDARLRRHAPAHLADPVSRASAPTGRSRTTSAGFACRSLPTARQRTSTRATTSGRWKPSTPGVTTILDFSHCNNTPEHADGALQGLRDAGIRAMFAYGYYPAPTAAPVFTDHGSDSPTHGASASSELSSDDALVTMGVALTEVGLLPFDQTIAEARSARRAGSAQRPAHRLQLGLACHGGHSRARPPRPARAPSRCTCTATRSTTGTSAGWPTTTARSHPARRRRSRWAWATR